MELYLYKTMDSNNTINKRLYDEHKYNINFKDSGDLIDPTIYLYSKDFIHSNYAYIPEFKRYYFINKIVVRPKDIYRLELYCDVLESFKDDILKCKCNVERVDSGNPFIDDNSYVSEVRNELLKYESTVEFEGEGQFIFSKYARRGD